MVNVRKGKHNRLFWKEAKRVWFALLLGCPFVAVLLNTAIYHPSSHCPDQSMVETKEGKAATLEAAAVQEQHVFCKFAESFVIQPPYMGDSDSAVVTPVKAIHSIDNTSFAIEAYASNDFVSNAVTKQGGWEKGEIQRFVTKMKAYSKKHGIPISDLTFVDIGANIGWYSMNMAALGAKVVAIEPMPSNLYLLRRTLCLEENKHIASNVILLAQGVGSKKQRCVMYSHNINRGDGHTHCHDGQEDDGFSAKDIPRDYTIRSKVLVDRLDDLLDWEKRTVVAVKMDTEGFEGHIVAGGPKFFSKVPYLQSEIMRGEMKKKGASKDEMLAALYSAGLKHESGESLQSLQKRFIADIFLVNKDAE